VRKTKNVTTARVFERNKKFKEGRELLQDDETRGLPFACRTEVITGLVIKTLAKDQNFEYSNLRTNERD
jgi:hypothetical protein